jgi:Fic family protein
MSNNVGLDTAIEVHIDLIQFFRDGHCTTVKEISQRYGLGERTAQRYLARVDRYVSLQRNGPNYRKARFE